MSFCYRSAIRMYCMNRLEYNKEVWFICYVSHVNFSLAFSAQTTDQRLDGKWQNIRVPQLMRFKFS